MSNPLMQPGSFPGYFNDDRTQGYSQNDFTESYYEPHHLNYYNLSHEHENIYGIQYNLQYQDPFHNLHDVLPSSLSCSLSSPYDKRDTGYPQNMDDMFSQPFDAPSLSGASITEIPSPKHLECNDPRGLGIVSQTPDLSRPSEKHVSEPIPCPKIKSKPGPKPKSDKNAAPKVTKSGNPKIRGRRASSKSEAGEQNRNFTCGVADCNKVFKRSEHLKRHVRSIHTNEKPFLCPTCGKNFSRSDNLNQHVRIHIRPKTKVSTIRAHHPMSDYPMDSYLPFMPFYQDSECLPPLPFTDLPYSNMMNPNHMFPPHEPNQDESTPQLNMELSFISPSLLS